MGRRGAENYSIHLFEGSWIEPYSRKSLLKIGRAELVRFKRYKKGGDYPLCEGEKLILLLPIRLSGRKKIALTWKKTSKSE